MTGFRVGKQRLVSKKKKNTPLKKLILAEREERKGETVENTEETAEAPIAADGPVSGKEGSQDESPNIGGKEENKEENEEENEEEISPEPQVTEIEASKPASKDLEEPSAPVVDGLCLDAPEFV